MIEDGEHSRYTLDTLIEQCGFNSRATFFRNFKKSIWYNSQRIYPKK